MEQKVIFTSDINISLSEYIKDIDYDHIFILTDTHTKETSLPVIKSFTDELKDYFLITIPAGDDNKNIESLNHIWIELSKNGATRRSLMINLGGGMITDIGGFAAATFKRGIKFINIPTSLLASVDAAVGGKTGINLNGLKNEVGVFKTATQVYISTEFFSTMDNENLLSGYAEMLKHGLLESENYFNKLISYDVTSGDFESLLPLLEESVNIKRKVVDIDPYEKGLRKALNLGHTVGHAFESFCMAKEKPVLHGYAVAWGLICELILSNKQCGFPSSVLHEAATFIKTNYPVAYFTCKDYDILYDYMTHDKKNDNGFINFSLLNNFGDIELNRIATKEEIEIMFDIFRDLMGI